jgi:hypothetical protein
MKITITQREFKTLKGALRRCDAGNDSFATDCFLLGLKLVKAENYSKSNKILRGILRCKTLVPKNEEKKRNL